MAIGKRLRFEVLRRDNYTCRYCGAKAPDVELHVDHVQAESLGGQDTPENLVTACVDCNQGKASTTPDAETVAAVEADAFRWSKAIEAAAAAMVDQESRHKDFCDRFEKEWRSYWYGYDKNSVPMHPDWRTSLKMFINGGLTEQMILDSIAPAMGSKASADDTFRYFCGICHTKLRDLHEAAKKILEAETDG